MKTILITAFVILAFGTVIRVEACSCSVDVLTNEKTLVETAKEESNAVFVGKLVRLTEPKKADGSLTGEVIAEFQVLTAWKGIETPRVTIYTTNICCICGFPFREGRTYIVYAYGKDKLFTGLCTRTVSIDPESKSNDEKYLGKPIILKEPKQIESKP